MLSFIQRGPIEQSPSRWWNSQQVWILNYLRNAITDTSNDCGQQYLPLDIRQDNKNGLRPCLVTLWSCYNIHCFPKYWGAGKIDHHTGHTLLFLEPYKNILGFSKCGTRSVVVLSGSFIWEHIHLKSGFHENQPILKKKSENLKLIWWWRMRKK